MIINIMIHNFFFQKYTLLLDQSLCSNPSTNMVRIFLKYHVSQNRIMGITKKHFDNRGPDVVPDFQILL